MGATMKDIARTLKIAESTVSRALNNQPSVKVETREAVVRMARALNYRPNAVARGLAIRKTNVVGLVISDIANPFFSEVVKGVEGVALKHGYSVILGSTSSDPKRELQYLDVLIQRQVDGIIYMSGRLPAECVESLRNSGRPVVAIARDGARHGIPSVRINNREEARKVTNYLISLGHVRIGFISGPVNDQESGLSRYDGYRQALEENAIVLAAELVQEGDFTLDTGYRSMQKLLSLSEHIRPTAVFAANDLMAVGAIKAISAAHLRVPQDVAVVGFDNTVVASISEPPLTTMAQPLSQIGREAMMMLKKLIDGEKPSEIEIMLECHLVVRGSCGSLHKAKHQL